MDEFASKSCTRRSHRLVSACRVFALMSLLLVIPPLHDAATVVVLVGPLVLAPAGYELPLLLACVSLFFAVASRLTRRPGGAEATGVVSDGEGASAHSAVDTGTEALPFEKASERRAVRWLLNGITTVALLTSISVAGFECLLATPYITEPAGPVGDRVVVVERNVLLAGHGDVYLVPGGLGAGRRIASYSADDGYSPMGNGNYLLEWRGPEPHFTAYGTPANPVGMYPAD